MENLKKRMRTLMQDIKTAKKMSSKHQNEWERVIRDDAEAGTQTMYIKYRLCEMRLQKELDNLIAGLYL